MSDPSTPMTGSDDRRAALRPTHPVEVHPTLRLSIDSPQDDDFDALADLFLGDDAPPASPPTAHTVTMGDRTREPRSDRVCIEAIVLGHLPVLASAWVRQYADHRARELACPVVLVRLRATGTSVEILPERSFERSDSLTDAILNAGSIARAWIIQVDETAEPDLGAIMDLDAITLLSGADEAATVASYRAIKALSGHDDRELRVMLMGSEPEQASRAWTRIERAAAAMLDQPLTYAGCVPKIDAPRATTIFRGSCDLTLDEVLAMIRRAPSPSTPAVSGPIDEKARLVPLPERPDQPPAPTRPPVCEPDSHNNATDAVATTLAGHVGDLQPLALVCPDAPQVELAVSPTGGLHLLARVQDTPGCTLEQLAIASAWAIKNHHLLTAAIPKLEASSASAPIEHLLTDRPAAVRQLLDSPLRVHLLMPMTVGATKAWYSTPLN